MLRYWTSCPSWIGDKIKRTLFIFIILDYLLPTPFHQCLASRTHMIYWDPDNIIFHAQPAPLLQVKPRDEVIFMCPYESLYILWTYNQRAVDSCSMWLDDNIVVDLLFKCPTKNTSRIARAPRLSSRIRGRHTNSSRRSYKYSSHLVNQSRGSENERKRYQRSIDNSETNHRFTMLIDEISWANGNPRFAVNRPVFFMAQSEFCRTKNMRLAVVNGDYRWTDEPKETTSLKLPRPTCENTKPGESLLRNTQHSRSSNRKPTGMVFLQPGYNQNDCSGVSGRLKSHTTRLMLLLQSLIFIVLA